MASWRFLSRILIAACLLAPLSRLHAQWQTAAAAGSTKGQFLVATPDIGDPRFAHTVILMVAHDRDGAFGITINRPLGSHSIAAILDSIGESHDGVSGDIPIYAGGPVQEQIGFILHTPDYKGSGTKMIGKGVAVTSSPQILRDIGRGKGPKKALAVFGYAGWGPGQLDAEIEHNAWVTTPLDPALIFDTDPDKIWDIAWSRRIINL
jgi:putative transcriptional regulator